MLRFTSLHRESMQRKAVIGSEFASVLPVRIPHLISQNFEGPYRQIMFQLLSRNLSFLHLIIISLHLPVTSIPAFITAGFTEVPTYFWGASLAFKIQASICHR